MPEKNSLESLAPMGIGSRRAKTNGMIAAPLPRIDIPMLYNDYNNPRASRSHYNFPQTAPILTSVSPEMAGADVTTPIARRASAAEKVLEQLRSRDLQKSGANPRAMKPRDRSVEGSIAGDSDTHRTPVSHFAPSPAVTYRNTPTVSYPALPRLSKSPSAPNMASSSQPVQGTPPTSTLAVPPPPGLLALLDGEHHTDELATTFEVGWPVLEQWLVAVGGGKDGDFGRVSMIYR